jgi:hypothetical protein
VCLFYILSDWHILEFETLLADIGYPTCKITYAGTNMGKILYPQMDMGNLTGGFFDGQIYGTILPNDYIPVAIPG